MVAKRYFESLGYRVTLVENITDIDDRIIQKGIAEGRTAREVAEEFADAYREDTDRLGLGRPDVEPLATEHIQEIIDLIAGLVEQRPRLRSPAPTSTSTSTAAPTTASCPSSRWPRCATAPASTLGEDKDDPLDFALWKGAKPGEPAWDSPWGPGRPGWHIECSAMSLKYLGAGFDIHGGGRDLIFPHHENEIAQAEGALDQPFARFWMHNGMLNLREEKMSKSVGNILTLRAHPRRAPAGGADHRLRGQPLPQPAGVQRASCWTRAGAAGGPAAQRLPRAGRPGGGPGRAATAPPR